MEKKVVSMGTFDKKHIKNFIHPFSTKEYNERLVKVRKNMEENNIDLLYVTMPENICYLHGYMTSWYKANSPMRYPQLYGTLIHVNRENFIHFDYKTEEPVLAKTSISNDNRFFPSRDGKYNLEFLIHQLKNEGWLKGTVALEYWSYIPNRAVSRMIESASFGFLNA